MNKCVQNCKEGEFFNEETSKCEPEEKEEVEKPAGENVGLCPPDRPIWDPESKSCNRCSSETPYWNEAQKKCVGCLEG